MTEQEKELALFKWLGENKMNGTQIVTGAKTEILNGGLFVIKMLGFVETKPLAVMVLEPGQARDLVQMLNDFLEGK